MYDKNKYGDGFNDFKFFKMLFAYKNYEIM